MKRLLLQEDKSPGLLELMSLSWSSVSIISSMVGHLIKKITQSLKKKSRAFLHPTYADVMAHLPRSCKTSSEQWPALLEFFLKFLPSHKSETELEILFCTVIGLLCKAGHFNGKETQTMYFDKENFQIQMKCHMSKHFSCLQPSQILNPRSCTFIAEITKGLPGEFNVDLVWDEGRFLKTETEIINYTPGQRIDRFWRNVFEIKNTIGDEKYPNVQKIVKISCSISYGSADLERGFSLSSKILS
ncbi:hypothetical protein PR048_002579 [Dryococelus australis]|uniref:Uncharacterized protein n=1 Tax=Dryococelus australis TaxID=614101 RepID=A0ABQ9IMZ5_9NEOP|nr:hypothetical protein PR048_002579 [Dryococelus australis]